MTVFDRFFRNMPKKHGRPNVVVPCQGKERDGYSPAYGFGIVDWSLLSALLETYAVCPKCKNWHLRLKIDTKNQGFASKLLLECSNV